MERIDTYVIIDGNNLAHSFFYTLGKLSNAKGEPTGIIYGLTRLLITVCRQRPDALTFVFDPIPEELLPVEEGGKHPPEFYRQLQAVIRLLGVLGVHYLVAEDESIADYVVAGAVNWAKRLHPPPLVFLYSNDHDFLQLVGENVIVVKPGKYGEIFDLDKIREKYGLEPPQLAELWSLTGDRTDGIPGVKNIGPVKGTALLKDYGDLAGAVAHLEKDERYLGAAKVAWDAYAQITLLDRELPPGCSINPSCTHLYDGLNEHKNAVRDFFIEYEFAEFARSLTAGKLFSP